MGWMRSRRVRRQWVWVAAWVAWIPKVAWAGWGDENWGQMVWGSSASLPSLSPAALLFLCASVVAVGARWMTRRRR